jgi:Cu2+-exporting ATPase
MGGDARGVRVVRNGSEPRVAVSELRPDDNAVVYAGEIVPVDGVVLTGDGDVDERTWTGEPLPRHVTEGDKVLAGSMVVDGRLLVAITATGDATRAGRLAAALEEAIAANTHTTDTAKRIADRLVVPMLAAGGLVFLGTRDLQRLVSLLIVDFGTGIRIAVPTSILSTMIAGARHDVLFRNGQSVEELAGIDTIVFDKTGTLTTGKPSVVGVSAERGRTDNEVLGLAAAAEGHLPHPLAGAVRRAARRRGLDLAEPTASRYHPGGGVEARIDGRVVLVGDPRLLADHGIAAPAGATQSSSSVFVAVDGEVAGRIRLRDTVRDDAQHTVEQLRAMGITRLWLATGDRPPAARAVSRQLGLDGYTAAMMPEAKAAMVRALRAEGRRVAVVGDGINDATAMAEANVAVAVPRGADLARETAGVVLSRDDLSTLVTAIELSREAMGLVRQNIALVAAPNAVALVMAAAGSLTPLYATAVNNGSTLVAALNALRPLRGRPGVDVPPGAATK